MSATEKIAEKYIDEVIGLAPLEVAIAFAIGVCLLSSPASGSAWLTWLTDDFSHSWYFLDALCRQKVGTLLALLAAGPIAIAIVRYALRKLLEAGEQSIAEATAPIYEKISNHVDNPNYLHRALQAAVEWRKVRAKKVTRSIRLSTFFLAISLITLTLLFRTMSGIDLIFGISFVVAAGCFLWVALKSYVNAYLPERLLLDASLGLSKVNITGAEGDI